MRFVPKLGSLDMHVRLAECEGVYISLVVEVGKTMIHEAMRALVAANCVQHVEKLCIRIESPIVFGNPGRREFLPKLL